MVVTSDRDVALAHAAACGTVVIEEYLDGPEVSLFCLTDGETVVPLQPAQDFKRVGDGDTGPTPAGWVPTRRCLGAGRLVDDIVARVVQPTVDELHRREMPFVGVVYAGLAMTSKGPRVIEFNARFGDPETQVVLARLRTPLAGLLRAAATGRLDAMEPLRWSDDAAVTVVIASEGYPAAPRTGDVIEGLADADAVEGAYVLHAGTAAALDGSVVSAGGRVLSVTAVGADLDEARARAYQAVARINLGRRPRTAPASPSRRQPSSPPLAEIGGSTPNHRAQQQEGG